MTTSGRTERARTSTPDGPADRPPRLHGRGGDKFHDDHARARHPRRAAGEPGRGDAGEQQRRSSTRASRSCSTTRSARSRRSTSTSTRTGSRAATAPRSPASTPLDEAKDLALVLQTGALPVEFVQVDRTDISATLGEDSLREALIAGIGGLIAVALFLLIFYRFLGVIAIIGLGIYGVLLYGALLLFNVTLTLPGIAGLILTIGVAADANIVIFERIKEEVRAGKSVRAAIADGLPEGLQHDPRRERRHDDHGVRPLRGRAPASVKGFALMLLIGTLLSMVTAVAATRALLGVLAGFRWFNNPAFMGASAPEDPRLAAHRLHRPRNVLVRALAATGAPHRHRLARRQGSQPRDRLRGREPGLVQDAAAHVGRGRAREAASSVGPATRSSRVAASRPAAPTPQFQIRTESLTAGGADRAQTDARARARRDRGGDQNVSASFSAQILRSAILAIVVSLALIVIYVTFRFEFKFAVPVLVALLHDILITLGVYSLTGREMTTATVAAVLTILGYSIYDTIIIFDRVRENMPLMRRSSFAAIANQSLWETIRRSLATTFITLLPVGRSSSSAATR